MKKVIHNKEEIRRKNLHYADEYGNVLSHLYSLSVNLYNMEETSIKVNQSTDNSEQIWDLKKLFAILNTIRSSSNRNHTGINSYEPFKKIESQIIDQWERMLQPYASLTDLEENVPARKLANVSFGPQEQSYQQSRQEKTEPIDHSIKHSYIYNKYFKNYASTNVETLGTRVPKTIEEYHQMLLDDKINAIEHRIRIEQIKSKKLLFTPVPGSQTKPMNIRPSINNLRMMNFR
jgi:hypothetical protein